MQLSKENSDAGGGNRSERPLCPPSARPGAPGRRLSPPTPLPGPGRGGPGASSPARLRGDPSTPQPARCRKRGRAWAPAAPSAPLGLTGLGARVRDSHGAAPSRGAQNTRHHGARPRSAPPLPAPGPPPRGEGRARPYLAEARGCHPGPARASSSPPASPHARQRAAFKSPGYSAGGESMRAGAARRGRGEAGRRWGCWEGVWRGGAGTQGKKAGGLQAVFVAATATGSLRVAPRLPYHYLGQCAASSPPKHLGESCPAPRGASPPLSQSATITPTRYSGHPPVPGPSSTPPIQDQP